MGRLRALVFLGLLSVTAGVAACASTDEEVGEGDQAAVIATKRQLAIVEDPSLLVEHPETLRALEGRGFDLGTRLLGKKIDNNRGFASAPEGMSIKQAIEGDIAEANKTDPGLRPGTGTAHRAFDVRWLASSEASFELVGVANRMDRRHATPNSCGETHLIYRLAYKNALAASRLPMTLMLVYPQAKVGTDCSRAASQWLAVAKGASDVTAGALATGPLAPLGRADRLELTYQFQRWPSSVRPNMGGHTEYAQRVFKRTDKGLSPVALENTPRSNLSASERTALAAWVASNIDQIDRGTAIVPEEFLAQKAISVAPKGLARGQNRPFALIFGQDGAGLGAIDTEHTSLIKSKAALLRRLDTMTCNGCHQSRSVAGFHMLGNDRLEMDDMNSLVDGASPHLREFLAFRRRDLVELASKKMEMAPLPFAERAGQGGYGTVCGLGDNGFASWTCDEGFLCSNLNGEEVGMCVSKKRMVGQACEESKVSFSADSHTDSVDGLKVAECVLPSGGPSICAKSGDGFPSGMCGGGCGVQGKVEGTAICGVAAPVGFNECIAKQEPYPKCIEKSTRAYRRACDSKTPCGGDYVCSGVSGAPPGVGACMPPYFIFQARVDGHVVGP